MPVKKIALTDAERAKRIRDAAREHETNNDPASFERAFSAVVRGKPKPNAREQKDKKAPA